MKVDNVESCRVVNKIKNHKFIHLIGIKEGVAFVFGFIKLNIKFRTENRIV